MTLYLKQLLVQWNICRIVRIAGGLPIMIVGIRHHDWPTALFGAAFLLAGLLSLQCCSGGSCATLPRPGKKEAQKPVEFEEIKN